MKRTPLRRVSKKQAIRLREYTKLKRTVLSGNIFCEMPDCHHRAFQVHHSKGRSGENLCNTATWILVCAGCHRKIHDNPKWARQKGYLKF